MFGQGPDTGVLRTYNSQGGWDGDNGDQWRIGLYKKVYLLTGTVNTAGSTITRVDQDGVELLYTYNTTLSKYVNTDGAGAFDTLSYSSATTLWTWTDGDSRATETYANANGGRITQSTDLDGNSLPAPTDF